MSNPLRIALLCLLLAACAGEEPRVDMPSSPPIETQGPVIFMGDSITELWSVNAVNAGIRGQQTSEMLERFERDVLSKRPSVVHILGGTNDVFRYDYPSTDALQEMANRAAASGARVIIGTIPPIYGHPELGSKVETWNASVRSIATSYGYTLVDYYPALNEPMFPDGVHVNADGYRAMCAVLTTVVQGYC